MAAPNLAAIFFMYSLLGVFLCFAAGRTPAGALPDDVVAELWLPVLAVSFFITTYSVFDVLGVGIVKEKYKITEKKAAEQAIATSPEELILAQRAQVSCAPGYSSQLSVSVRSACRF